MASQQLKGGNEIKINLSKVNLSGRILKGMENGSVKTLQWVTEYSNSIRFPSTNHGFNPQLAKSSIIIIHGQLLYSAVSWEKHIKGAIICRESYCFCRNYILILHSVVLARMIKKGEIHRKTYQKIEDTVAQHFKGYAHVAVVLEPVQHFDAEAEKKKKLLANYVL